MVIEEENEAERLLEAIKSHPFGRNAEVIGRMTEENRKRVTLHTLIGGHRILDMLTREAVPKDLLMLS
jgi:hydrogenase expression/formation protein HypE